MGFNVGDVVRLKSGGPDMTVSCGDWEGRVATIWFDGGNVNSYAFFTDMLELVDDESEGFYDEEETCDADWRFPDPELTDEEIESMADYLNRDVE